MTDGGTARGATATTAAAATPAGPNGESGDRATGDSAQRRIEAARRAHTAAGNSKQVRLRDGRMRLEQTGRDGVQGNSNKDCMWWGNPRQSADSRGHSGRQCLHAHPPPGLQTALDSLKEFICLSMLLRSPYIVARPS